MSEAGRGTEPSDAALGGEAGFWAFSLDFYARPGVAESCLALQDRHGADVNILLLCCWLGWSGWGRLSREALARAEAGVAAWRGEIVERLRALRRALKGMPVGGAPALRREIARLELAAEREAQRLLLAALPPGPAGSGDKLGDAEENLAMYLAANGWDVELAAPLLAALRRAA